MPNFFKKLNRNTNNFFHKIEHGTTNFFTKTVPDATRKVGNTIDEASDIASTVVRKVGNTLEKASPVVSAIGMATGQPELVGLGSSLSNASQQASQLRGQIRQGSNGLSNSVRGLNISS